MGDIFAAGCYTVVFLGDSSPGSRTLLQNLAGTDRWMLSGHSLQSLPHPEQKIIREMEQLFKRL
jgi:hypothetical protein